MSRIATALPSGGTWPVSAARPALAVQLREELLLRPRSLQWREQEQECGEEGEEHADSGDDRAEPTDDRVAAALRLHRGGTSASLGPDRVCSMVLSRNWATVRPGRPSLKRSGHRPTKVARSHRLPKTRHPPASPCRPRLGPATECCRAVFAAAAPKAATVQRPMAIAPTISIASEQPSPLRRGERDLDRVEDPPSRVLSETASSVLQCRYPRWRSCAR